VVGTRRHGGGAKQNCGSGRTKDETFVFHTVTFPGVGAGLAVVGHAVWRASRLGRYGTPRMRYSDPPASR
ncbi:MAG TPA: hypothetical protein VFI45_08495, partial [Candidatus Acidoferrum sp.]|nr:hypothetical protein [Candidatus Acidoferrum sp.]